MIFIIILDTKKVFELTFLICITISGYKAISGRNYKIARNCLTSPWTEF